MHNLYALGVERNVLPFLFFFFSLFFHYNGVTSDLPPFSATRTIFAVGERVYPLRTSPSSLPSHRVYILRACDIIALIHFRCVLASKHKSGRPRKSYGTMLTVVASSPWTEYIQRIFYIRVRFSPKYIFILNERRVGYMRANSSIDI